MQQKPQIVTALSIAQVVLLYSEGWTQSKIAKTLNLDVQIVIDYLQEYFNPKKRPIRQRLARYTLNPDQTADLVAHIQQNPNVSVQKIISYIEQQYGCTWSEAAVYLFLKIHNFSRKSKQVLDHEEITKSGQKKLVYRSVAGWFRDK